MMLLTVVSERRRNGETEREGDEETEREEREWVWM